MSASRSSLAPPLVEVREHGVLHVGDRAVARGEHLVAAVAERELDHPAVVGARASGRSARPRSSAASTSFIDCGVTYDRRASCALESPGRSRRIDSAVYFGTVSPNGATSAPISRRSARSRRPMT